MKPGIVAEGLNCHHNSRYSGFLAKSKLEKVFQALRSALAQLTQQFAIVEKISAKYLGNGKDILPMRYGINNLDIMKL